MSGAGLCKGIVFVLGLCHAFTAQIQPSVLPAPPHSVPPAVSATALRGPLRLPHVARHRGTAGPARCSFRDPSLHTTSRTRSFSSSPRTLKRVMSVKWKLYIIVEKGPFLTTAWPLSCLENMNNQQLPSLFLKTPVPPSGDGTRAGLPRWRLGSGVSHWERETHEPRRGRDRRPPLWPRPCQEPGERTRYTTLATLSATPRQAVSLKTQSLPRPRFKSS